MEANLELAPAQDGKTLLVPIGSYQPPLRRVGQTIGLRCTTSTAR